MIRFSLVLVLLFAVAAGLQADDVKALDGRWKLTAIEIEGKTREIGDNPPHWVIKGGKVHYAGDLLAELTIHAGDSPRGIDLAWVKPKRVYEGVFTLDGDTLKICVNHQTEGAKNRPQDLKTE